VAHTYLANAQRVPDCSGDLVQNRIELDAVATPEVM